MYCDGCGAALQAEQKFCASCGKPIGAVPVPQRERSLARHVRILAVLWFCVAALGVLAGGFFLFLGAVADAVIPAAEPGAALARWLGPFVLYLLGAAMVLVSLPSFAAGWGLSERRSWGRILALVLGFLILLHPPFGTALGIYTLWVLLPARAAGEYRELAGAGG